MAPREEKSPFGSIKIYNDVICEIASAAACEVKGVAKTGGGLVSTISDLLGRRNFRKGVKIDYTNNNELQLTIYITVEYGVNIPDIAVRVQENVRRSVEQMAGLSLAEIDVSIQGVVPLPKDGRQEI